MGLNYRARAFAPTVWVMVEYDHDLKPKFDVYRSKARAYVEAAEHVAEYRERISLAGGVTAKTWVKRLETARNVERDRTGMPPTYDLAVYEIEVKE